MQTGYLNAVRQFLGEWFGKMPGKKLAIPRGYILEKNGEYFVSFGGTARKLESLKFDEIYEIHAYIVDNVQLLHEYTETVDLENNWIIEPEEISVDGETIGAIGVTKVEEIEGERMMSVLYLSSDGSFSTLTMFGEGSQSELELALQDLEKTREVLSSIISKLQGKFSK